MKKNNRMRRDIKDIGDMGGRDIEAGADTEFEDETEPDETGGREEKNPARKDTRGNRNANR